MSQRPAALMQRLSAGGVVFRARDGSMDVALICPKGGQVWSLPKGLVDEGETVEQTALREVREEAGVDARITASLGESRYWYFIRRENVKCRKTVKYFLMEYAGGDVGDHDEEVSEAAWVPMHEALERLTYKGDREVMTRAIGMLGDRVRERGSG